jgi:hypothetical protein
VAVCWETNSAARGNIRARRGEVKAVCLVDDSRFEEATVGRAWRCGARTDQHLRPVSLNHKATEHWKRGRATVKQLEMYT